MINLLRLVLALLIIVSIYSEASVPAKEAACRACHGQGGAEPIVPSYPKLNGQNKAYLISSLKAYRAGLRKAGLAAAMAAQANQLSDADIEALATFYASQP